MKIIDAIYAADRMRHNEIEPIVKLRWLSELDGRIWQELFETHECGCGGQGSKAGGYAVVRGDAGTGFGSGGCQAAAGAESCAGFRGYDETTDVAQTVLLVGPPFEELYPRYLAMQIDLAQDEIARYNNAAALFTALYRQYANWFHQHHLPKNRTALRF